MMSFFQQKQANEVKPILSRFDAVGSTILDPCVVLLLMAHFKEKSDTLILQVNVSVHLIYNYIVKT